MKKKEEKSAKDKLQDQLRKIKGLTVNILTYQKNRLTVVERTTIIDIYELIDDIFLDRIENKRYTVEEFVDARLVEYGMLLSKTKNSKVKELLKILKGGIEW